MWYCVSSPWPDESQSFILLKNNQRSCFIYYLLFYYKNYENMPWLVLFILDVQINVVSFFRCFCVKGIVERFRHTWIFCACTVSYTHLLEATLTLGNVSQDLGNIIGHNIHEYIIINFIKRNNLFNENNLFETEIIGTFYKCVLMMKLSLIHI